MNTDKVSVTLVRDGNGNVDVPGTLAGFQTDLQTYTLREQADLEQIRDAVESFWNEQPLTTKSVSMDALASAVFAKLNMPVTTYAEATSRIKNYIRTATDTFAVVRGKDGGCSLRSRLTADELAKADAQASKLAARKSA